MSGHGGFAHSPEAERLRGVKARELAGWCWGRGYAAFEVAGWEPGVRTAVAREAGTRPGSDETWELVMDLLERKAAWAGQDEARWADHGVEPRPEWMPREGAAHTAQRAETDAGEPAGGEKIPSGQDQGAETPPEKNISSADAERSDGASGGAAADPESVPPGWTVQDATGRFGMAVVDADGQPVGGTITVEHVTAPKGWTELILRGPLERPDALCFRCGRPAVVGAPFEGVNVWRCGGHPPQDGEWGARLDWTPRAVDDCPVCVPNRCLHGRCRNYQAGKHFTLMSTSSLHDERSMASGKKRGSSEAMVMARRADNARKEREKQLRAGAARV